jgi:membrane protein YdbS with pleckstrin-like domain
MRFHLGAIPGSPDFVPNASWRPLRQPPSPWLENLLALPIGVVAAVTVAALWFLVTPLRDIMPAMSLPAFLLLFAGIVVVHELIHALVHPMAGRSPHSILGFWKSLGFYAHYDGEMSRNRLVVCLLMPLFIISIVPLLVSAAAQVSSGWVAFVSALNALCACVDMLLAGLILYLIPANRMVRFKSWRIYWREHDTLAA